MADEGSTLLNSERWLLVTKVFANSEAERSGIREGDHIEKYDGMDVGSDADRFGAMVAGTADRDNIFITIARDGERKTLSIKGGGLGISVVPAGESLSSGIYRGTSEFATLSAYGQFLSGFGWLVVSLGAFAVILGLSSRNLGMTVFLGGVFAIVLGVGLVVNGQVVSCFVSIERNTRASADLLKSLVKATK
jgi:hypothetical protein